jgi:hypothetical protein
MPRLPATAKLRKSIHGSIHRTGAWYAYVVEEVAGGVTYTKVGTTSRPDLRRLQLQSGNPRPLIRHILVACADRDDALRIERATHQAFRQSRVPGRDWFQAEAAPIVAFVRGHRLAIEIVDSAALGCS